MCKATIGIREDLGPFVSESRESSGGHGDCRSFISLLAVRIGPCDFITPIFRRPRVDQSRPPPPPPPPNPQPHPLFVSVQFVFGPCTHAASSFLPRRYLLPLTPACLLLSENIAFGMPSKIRTRDPDLSSRSAVDGNSSTCVTSDPADNPGWLRVDLQAVATVYHVTLVTGLTSRFFIDWLIY